MATSGWLLRPAAEADLAEIWQRGVGIRGVEQADRDVDGLFALFGLLAEFPGIARERSEFNPPVRIHPSGSHLVVYRCGAGNVEIVRVLHAHQNLTAYLQEG